MTRVPVKRESLTWARERAGQSEMGLRKRFPKLNLWESGDARPTLKQLESFAKATHTPIGYLFLKEPPVERLPIPDFRTVGNAHIARPSPDLLDTLYICQQRQEWYRDFVRSESEPTLGFVGSVDLTSDTVATAGIIRQALGFSLEERRNAPTWTDALRWFKRFARALVSICSTPTSSSAPRTCTTAWISVRPSGTGSSPRTPPAPCSASRKSATKCRASPTSSRPGQRSAATASSFDSMPRSFRRWRPSAPGPQGSSTSPRR